MTKKLLLPTIIISIFIAVWLLIVIGASREVSEGESEIVLGGLGFLKNTPSSMSRNIFLTVSKKPTVTQVPPKNNRTKVVETKRKAIVKIKKTDGVLGFKYVGYLMKYGKDEAFIIGGDEMYVVKRGDILPSNIEVLSISREQVKLKNRSKNELVILNMNEKSE